MFVRVDDGCVNVVDYRVVQCCCVIYVMFLFVARRTFAVTCFLAVMLNTLNLRIANIVENK